MKRIILLCGLLTAFFLCFADAVEYKQCSPVSGSTISSFDFELEFDIEKALITAETAKPGNTFGIGYKGGVNSANATLYKGDIETGEILGVTNTANFTGKSDGFETNGRTIKVSFDSSLPVISNQLYTVKIDNAFYLYPTGSAVFVTATKADYKENPIILTFTGKASETQQLFVEKTNIENNEELNLLNDVEFLFNLPFNIKNDAIIELREGSNIIAKTSELKISPDNEKILKAYFGNEVLLKGHSYSIILPANSLSLTEDPSVGNLEYNVNVNGSSTAIIALASSKVEVDSNGIPTSVTFVYDLPVGTNLNSKNITGSRYGFLSEDGSDSSTNFDTNYTFVENNKGLKWDISSVRFKPSTTYNFTKPGNTLIVFDSDGNILKEYEGEDVKISFTAPSVEEAGFAPMEFSNPILKTELHSDNIEYEQDMALPYIQNIYFGLKDNYYFVGNAKYDLTIHPDALECSIYEVTADGDKLLQNLQLDFTLASDKNGYYNLAKKELQTYLYEGKKYKLVIPTGYFTAYPVIRNVEQIMDLSRCNYIKSPELVYTFTGTTPSQAVMLDCNVQNNAEVSSLYNIIWTFDGNYRLSDDVTTIIRKDTSVSGIQSLPINCPVTVSNYMGKTMVMIDFVSKISGTPLKITKGDISTFTVPKGLIVNIMNDEIVNDEIVLTVIGGEEALPAVDVNLTINDLHSASHKAVKGEKYSFTVAPNNDWKVESVMHGDKVLSAKNGVYTTEPLNENAEIRANLEYAGTWADYSETTGVWTVKDSNIRIYSDNQQIVVDGVTPDNEINVYSVSGLHINSTRVADNHDCVRITVAPGQVYIVTVDGKAAKISMKN